MPIEQNRYVFWDTETVSIAPPYIISLAYIVFEKGEKIDKGMIICNPDYPINPEASKINGFTDESVKDKPFFDTEWNKIRKYFDNAILIGHNSSNFDWRALKAENERYGFKLPKCYHCDTLKNAKRLISKDKVDNYKLETLINYFKVNVNRTNYHDALFDVEMTIKVYNQLVKLSGGKLLIELPK